VGLISAAGTALCGPPGSLIESARVALIAYVSGLAWATQASQVGRSETST
jgi:hypothetical protein